MERMITTTATDAHAPPPPPPPFAPPSSSSSSTSALLSGGSSADAGTATRVAPPADADASAAACPLPAPVPATHTSDAVDAAIDVAAPLFPIVVTLPPHRQRGGDDGDAVELLVSPRDAIAAVVQRAVASGMVGLAAAGVAAAEETDLVMVHGGVVLDDGRSVEECGIAGGDSVYVIERVRGGAPKNGKRPTKIRKLNPPDSDTGSPPPTAYAAPTAPTTTTTTTTTTAGTTVPTTTALASAAPAARVASAQAPASGAAEAGAAPAGPPKSQEMIDLEKKIENKEKEIGIVEGKRESAEAETKNAKEKDEKGRCWEREKALQKKEISLRKELEFLLKEKEDLRSQEKILLERVTMPPPLILIPTKNRPFTKRVTDCVIPKDLADDCQSDHIIAMDKSVDEAMDVIDEWCPQHSSRGGENRVPPLVISRVSRGGKTALLSRIFLELKRNGYAPIFINLNGGFDLRPGETHLDAILRLIAVQLIDVQPGDNLMMFKCDKDALLTRINETAKIRKRGRMVDVPVVLIIDELNTLGVVQKEAGDFLAYDLLDIENRYVVFSTHWPMNLDNLSSLVDRPSIRGCVGIDLPESDDLSKIRGMSLRCSAVTPFECLLLANIPSLIYDAKKHGMAHLYDLFKGRFTVKDSKKTPALLLRFVSAVRGGNEMDDHCFDGLTSVRGRKVVWPFYHIACVVESIASGPSFQRRDSAMWESVLSVVCHLRDALPLFAEREHTGLEWEVTTLFALTLQALPSLPTGATHNGPFGILEGLPRRRGFHLQFVNIPGEINTPDDAKVFIENTVAATTCPRLSIFVPSCATFQDYDGFVTVTLPPSRQGTRAKPTQIFAYQCKINDFPKKDAHAWIHSAFLLRYKPPKSTTGPKNKAGWVYYTREETQSLLGHSLFHLLGEGNIQE